MLSYNINEVTLLDINALIDKGLRFRLDVAGEECIDISSLDNIRSEASVSTRVGEGNGI